MQMGSKFKFRTMKGRVGTAEVLNIVEGEAMPYLCRWYDANGKHYEWFSLNEFETVEML